MVSMPQVTRGVRITATPLFVPEHSKLQSEGSPRPTYFFAYWCVCNAADSILQDSRSCCPSHCRHHSSFRMHKYMLVCCSHALQQHWQLFVYHGCSIRMALLATSQQKAGGERKPLKTVQLRSRRWRIRDSSGELVDDIFGDGVISQFPVLTEGDSPAEAAASISSWESVSCRAAGQLVDSVSGDGVIGVFPLLKAGVLELAAAPVAHIRHDFPASVVPCVVLRAYHTRPADNC
jgi:uncharacterized protein affecting Mg2+/Co2+ transport